MATKYDQSSATRPVSIRSHTSAFQVHFKHTSSALEMSSVNPPNVTADFVVIIVINLLFILYRLHFLRYQHPETRMK